MAETPPPAAPNDEGPHIVDQYFRMLEENGMIHRLPLGADQGRPCLCQCQAAGFTHLELKALTLLVNSRRAYICSDDPYDETDYEPLAQSALAKIRALLPLDSTP